MVKLAMLTKREFRVASEETVPALVIVRIEIGGDLTLLSEGEVARVLHDLGMAFYCVDVEGLTLLHAVVTFADGAMELPGWVSLFM